MAKKISQLTQITAAQLSRSDLVPVVDVSAGQTKYATIADLTGLPDFGWTAAGETWAYSSWDSNRRIGVITIPSDGTTKYTVKNRIRFSQTTGGTKYGIIHKVEATQLTVHFPSGTTLNNEAISTPMYSPLDSPYGFPTSPNSWYLSTALSSTTATTSNSAWQNTGAVQLPLGIGDWRVTGNAAFQKASSIEMYTALSTSSSAGSHKEMTVREYRTGTGNPWLNVHRHSILNLNLAAAGTLYILFKTGNSGDNYDARGDTAGPHQTTIEALTNYL